jgi:hypothetical protein
MTLRWFGRRCQGSVTAHHPDASRRNCCWALNLWRLAVTHDLGPSPGSGRLNMFEATEVAPIVAAEAKASTGGLIPVAIFCGLGLLLSLVVLILDQYAPGDWF